jgi:hypothetical protein
VERERHGFGPCAPTEGALDLGLVRAAIQDGLLMVFGPDGDPVPPQVFGAGAAEQPDAGVRLVGGPPVRAERIAAVLAAQASGQFGSGHGGGEAWIRAMLGSGPEPEMARSDDLLGEGCTVDVVAFGRELMLTSPNGATFLIAAARSRTPISLRVAGEGPIAPGDLVARLLASADRDHPSPSHHEFAAPACKAWLEGDALRIDLPEVGVVDLARTDDDAGAAAPSVSLFMASGEVATIDDLLSALSTPIAPPSASGHDDPLDPPLPRYATDRQPPPAAPLAISLPDPLAAEPDRVALVVVRGLPKGARLSAGVESGDGSWLLTPSDLPGLSMTSPPEGASDLALEVAAIAIASPDGVLTSAAKTVFVPLRSVAIQPAPSAVVEPGPSPLVAPAPTPTAEPWSSRLVAPVPAPTAEPGPSGLVEPAPSAMVEPGSSPSVEPAPAAPDEPAHGSMPLGLDPQVLSGDGPFDAVVVRDLPAGVTLSAGTYDAAIAGWVLLPHQLSELSVITASGQSAEFTLCLLGVCLRLGGGARPRVLARVPVTTG